MFRIIWSGGVAPGRVKAGGVKDIVSAKCMGPKGLLRVLGPRDPGAQGPRDHSAQSVHVTRMCRGQLRGLKIIIMKMFRIVRSGAVTHGGVTAGGVKDVVKDIVSAKCMGPMGPPRALGPRGQRPWDTGTQGPKEPSAQSEIVTHTCLGQPRGPNIIKSFSFCSFWWCNPGGVIHGGVKDI